MQTALIWLSCVLLLLVTTSGAQAMGFVWAGKLGGALEEHARGVAVDGSGNVYTVGNFSGTADFDPDLGTTFNLTSAGDFDAFISKLDNAGNFVWAGQLGGTSSGAEATAVAVDGSGNVYTVGRFGGTVDFDPGPGTFNLTHVGIWGDGFISKLDSAGNFVWARQLAGDWRVRPKGVAVDGSGNVYTVGYFNGTADFDPGPGTFELTTGGGDETFISKLDTDGNFVWAGQLGVGGGPGQNYASDVAVDSNGNVYTVGYFDKLADFDPGPGTFNLVSSGEWDAFVSKLDNAGNFVWAVQLGGRDDDRADAVAVDVHGNVHTVGHFRGSVDFDPGPGTYYLTSGADWNTFISKLDSAGNFVWAGHLGARQPYGVAVDGSGNVYTAGRFDGTADFDPGPGTFNLTPVGAGDAFISKLDNAGNFVWAGQLGGAEYVNAYDVFVDGSGSVYAVGYFFYRADFDPGPGVFNLTSAGESDAFVAKLSFCSSIVVQGQDPTMVYFNPAPPSLSFDVVVGYLSDLQSDEDFSQATCMGTFSSSPAEDDLPNPSVGEGRYYLARGLSCCTEQGYGDSGLIPDPRDDLNVSSPCP